MIISDSGNTKLQLDDLGDVELRYLSAGDLIEILRILASHTTDDKETVVRILHRQMKQPVMSIDAFRNLPDDTLGTIAAAYIKKEDHAFQYYKAKGNIFTDFNNALRDYSKEKIAQSMSAVPFSRQLQKSVELLTKQNQQFARIGLLGHQTAIQKAMAVNTIATEVLRAQNMVANSLGPLDMLSSTRKQLSGFAAAYDRFLRPSLSAQQNVIQRVMSEISNLKKQIPIVDASLTAQMLQTANVYANVARVAMEQLRPQIGLLQNWLDRNQSVFAKYSTLWDYFEKTQNMQQKEAIKILRKYKWFISPSMPVDVTGAIVRVARKKGRTDKDINKLFISHFESDNWKNLSRMVSAWKKNVHFKKRMPILVACVKTLQISPGSMPNTSAVVLPTLISQIDGLLTDYSDAWGIPKLPYNDSVKAGIITKTGKKTQFRAKAPDVMGNELDDLVKDVFLNILFQRSQKGVPLETPFNFNRHKIMHGESLRYGRKDYVVRAFMVLDFLAYLK
jgi:hypothetical protein